MQYLPTPPLFFPFSFFAAFGLYGKIGEEEKNVKPFFLYILYFFFNYKFVSLLAVFEEVSSALSISALSSQFSYTDN